jgi:hypothetical protein
MNILLSTPTNLVETMKNSVFWDITACGLLKVDQRIEGTYRLHLQVEQYAKKEISTKQENLQSIQNPCFFMGMKIDFSN